jgi:hypothetical protein
MVITSHTALRKKGKKTGICMEEFAFAPKKIRLHFFANLFFHCTAESKLAPHH